MDRITGLPRAPVKSIPLLIDTRYALLWGGQAISRLGDDVFATTAILWIATRLTHGMPWAPLAVSGVLLAGEIPQFVVGPPAGVYVDRWGKKRTMLAMDALRAAILAALMLVAGALALPFGPAVRLPSITVLGAVYVTIALVTAASQFFGPARLALIGDIVPDKQRERASCLAQTSAAIISIVGPPLAAALFFTLGIGWALGLDAASFLLSYAVIVVIPAPESARRRALDGEGHMIAELIDGLRILRGNATLMALLVVGVLISLGLAAVETLSIFFVRQNLHASAALFGLFAGAQGAGAILGAVLGGTLGARLGVRRLLWQAAVLLGVLFIVLSRQVAFVPALAVIFLVGAAFAVMEVAEAPLLLRAAPRAYLGRVYTILYPAFGLASAASALLASWLASTVLRGFQTSLGGARVGPLDSIFAVAGALVIFGGLYARARMPDVVVEPMEPAPAH